MNDLLAEKEVRDRFVLLPVTDLVLDADSPWHCNKDSQDYQELRDSIAEFGILEPLLVRIDDGRVVVITGTRRLSIALELGLESVPVIFVDPQTQFEIEMIRNETNLKHRQHVLPSEIAKALKRERDAREASILIGPGEDKEYKSLEIAMRYEFAKSSYYRYLSLNSLPDELLEAVDRKQLSLRAAADYCIKLNKHNIKVLVDFCKRYEVRIKQRHILQLLRLQEEMDVLNIDIVKQVICEKSNSQNNNKCISLSEEFIARNIPDHLVTEDLQLEYLHRAVEFYKRHVKELYGEYEDV